MRHTELSWLFDAFPEFQFLSALPHQHASLSLIKLRAVISREFAHLFLLFTFSEILLGPEMVGKRLEHARKEKKSLNPVFRVNEVFLNVNMLLIGIFSQLPLIKCFSPGLAICLRSW